MELLTASDVARELGVSHQYITKLARQGKLPGVHVGRYLLFERRAVEAYVVSRRGTIGQFGRKAPWRKAS